MAAVAGASPVTMTARTPSVCSSVINAAESGRGGSLRATIPASFIAAGGPIATASTRKPCASSSFAVLDASGAACVRPATTAKAPFTARTVAPPGSAAVASDIFVPGSNGTNLISFGRSEATFFAAADRMAVSTGSCPPSELARAATPKTCDSSKPDMAWTAVTFSSFCVSVPVLSAHSTSIRSDLARRPNSPEQPLPRRAIRRSRTWHGRRLPSVRFASACRSYPRTARRSDRILPAVRTRQSSHSQDVRFVEAGHGMDGGYLQFVLRQRAGLIRAQHVDACRFIHGREPRRKDAQLRQSPCAECRRKGKGGRQSYWDRRQNRGEHQGNDLSTRHLEKVGIPYQHHDDDAIEHGEIAHHTQNGLLLRTFDVRGANQIRRASKLCARSGRRDHRDRLTAPHQRSGISFEPGASFDRNGFAGEHGLVKQHRPLSQAHVGGNHGPER